MSDENYVPLTDEQVAAAWRIAESPHRIVRVQPSYIEMLLVAIDYYKRRAAELEAALTPPHAKCASARGRGTGPGYGSAVMWSVTTASRTGALYVPQRKGVNHGH